MIKNFKKRMSVLILTVLVMSTSLISPIYASENYGIEKIEGQDYSISEDGNDAVTINSKDGIERVSVKEDDNTRKVTIYNNTTGEEEYLILNKGVVGLILTRVPGGQVVGSVIGTISTIVGGGTLLIPNDSSHGLKFTIKKVKHYRSRLGKRHVWYISKSIVSVSRY